MSPTRSKADQLSQLQKACSACTLCADQGIIAEAAPVFAGNAGARMLLVGQAPGPTERSSRRPFSGRAGKELDRWMLRAGFASAEDFRNRVYIAALMRCFPGRHPRGGDLRPPKRAIDNCARWLDAELELLQPEVIIPVGQMAIARFLGPGPLEQRVGRSSGDRPAIVPLPHPSGQSRWLNDRANRERLETSLAILSRLRAGLYPGR